MVSVPSIRRLLEVKRLGPVTLVRCQVPILFEADLVDRIGKQLLSLADRTGQSLVFNLGMVHVMASAMVGKLIALHRKLKEGGKQLVLCHLQQHLYEKIFEVHRLSQLFRLCPSEQDALNAHLSSEPEDQP